MSTDLYVERDAFNPFLDGRPAQAQALGSMEEAIREFRAYQRELAAARQKVQEARAARDHGEFGKLDIDELIQEVAKERLCVRGKSLRRQCAKYE